MNLAFVGVLIANVVVSRCVRNGYVLVGNIGGGDRRDEGGWPLPSTV